jgi:hypothetical protein
MSYALSNPYELILGGVAVKTSPMGTHGWFIANRDLNAVGPKAEKFKAVLFAQFEIDQDRELDGIKVHYRKPEKTHEAIVESKEQTAEPRIRASAGEKAPPQ